MTTSRRPRKPQSLPITAEHAWMDRYFSEQDTYEFWFKQAKKLNPEYFSEVTLEDNIPEALIRALYPEIVALGPCAPKILKAFNIIKAANGYIKRERPDPSSVAYKAIEEYMNFCYTPHLLHERENTLAVFIHRVEPGSLYSRFNKNFELIDTKSLVRAYGDVLTYYLGPLTACAIHMVHRGTTQYEKPPYAVNQAKDIIKALQKMELTLLQERIITEEHLTHIKPM